ncbi:DNA ligase D [Mesorhizobium sp. LHD-90]|uniref:DNA ligase D n=1 Tax=Mesorhizobium sp. LHD-90 TaxID=3071414 RepID=UPI0027E0CA2D|nr:DNA ligase D [Mesorhizobium sp. LHD-90]MDQ6432605.1 DNA ligase D [Mesorhizobium sp. LHD-90]
MPAAHDPLSTYRAKRDFRITSEPSGEQRRKAERAGGGKFVIHKHDATRLHYDLRLEHDGVLWSWAVTRGPSPDPHEKRLAVHVEDHPLDYGSFEGVIPEGQYGAGAVIVWDEGEWMPAHDPARGMKKGHIDFTLKGNKLNGEWHLVRLKPRPGEKKDNWLLIKSNDAFARPGEDILQDAPQSVVTGRTIEDVAEGRSARADRKPAKANERSKAAGKGAAKKAAAETPDFVEPMLATLRREPPDAGEWLHEVKFDGYRIQAHLDGGKVKLLTRKGLDWTQKFGKSISEAVAGLDCKNAVVDGEIVVLADKGVASFSALQAALSGKHTDKMIFYVFDLLFLDGQDLREEPLVERKERLSALIGESDGPLRYSEHFVEPGKTMLRHACRMGLEGVVSKRADAPYESGRSLDWIKSKCTNRQEFVIVGYVPSNAAGRGVRSLLVGYNENGKLRYAGRVGTGFSSRMGDELKQRMDRLKAKSSPFDKTPPGQKGAIWLKPELVAEIEFRSWTTDGIIRHSSFQGFRDDKPVKEVVAEVPAAGVAPAGGTKAKARRQASKGRQDAVTLSHPEKLLWPKAGVTKQGLLEHYEAVWPRMQRFVVDRPLSLVRAPDGVEGQRFFQKHASKGMHESIRRMKDPEDGEELLYISDFEGLSALVQFGVVEIHIWGATIEKIDTPDQVVFDLDPDEGLDVEDVRKATWAVKWKLDELELPNFLKTSGGKGFHVVVPLKPKADWAAVKGFAHDFAQAMAESEPDKYTSTLSKKARTGRIFIDYLRNGRGSTTVAPFSARGKPDATVSVPVPWDMLDGLTPDHFAIGNKALERALKAADPWVGFFEAGRVLTWKG